MYNFHLPKCGFDQSFEFGKTLASVHLYCRRVLKMPPVISENLLVSVDQNLSEIDGDDHMTTLISSTRKRYMPF